MEERRVLTEIMIDLHPRFLLRLTKVSLDQFIDQNKQNVDVVIGVDRIGMLLAYDIICTLNNQRKESGQKTCRVVYAHTNLDEFWFSQWFLGKIILQEGLERPKQNDDVVFVHCSFDDPKEHLLDVPWKFADAPKKRYATSCLLQDPKQVKRVIKMIGGNLIQSIVLPIPYEEYEKFMAE